MLKNLFKNITLVSLFAFTRLVNLTHFPPFIDELLYARWTTTLASDPKQFLLPLIEDGQPPLYFWLSSFILSITHSDPILILRLISVVFGLASLFLLVRLGSRILSARFGYVLGLLYILFPMFLWYDRLAMRESMITFSGLLILTAIYQRFVEHKSAFSLLFAGFLIGIMTKGTALLFIPVIMVVYLFFALSRQLVRRDYYQIFAILALTLALFLVGNQVFTKGSTFLSFSTIITQLYPNLYSAFSWLITYSTWPLLILLGYGIFIMFRQKRSLLIASLSLFALILTLEIISAKIFFPRYFLWIMPLYLLPLGWGITELSKRIVGKLAVFLLFLPLLRFDYHLINSPLLAPFPVIERWQYIYGWPSGYGIKELANQLSPYPVDYLVVEKNEACRTGVPYYNNQKYELLSLSDPQSIKSALDQGGNVYLCLSQLSQAPALSVEPLIELSRPGNESTLRFSKVIEVYE